MVLQLLLCKGNFVASVSEILLFSFEKRKSDESSRSSKPSRLGFREVSRIVTYQYVRSTKYNRPIQRI